MARRRSIIGALCSAVSVVVLAACGNTPPTPAGMVRATVGGETFFLEPVLDNASRTRGLSGREVIPEDSGMIFVFPNPRRLSFVMRDCLVPIDLIFVADNQRVVNTHAMTVEPRRPNEPDMVYEARLTRYSSEGRVRIAIELAGGSIERLGLAPGDTISIDGLERLKMQTR